MSEEAVKQAEAAEGTAAKPTITIAEKEGAETAAETTAEPVAETPAEPEDIHYQAVEKEGSVTAIWEMQGQKHLRTIDPRSNEGKQILALFETAA
jgi:hypothetical protein